MLSLRRAFRAALAAAGWRRLDLPEPAPQIGAIVGLTLVMAGTTVLSDWSYAGEGRAFQLYGVNSALAIASATIALFALFSPRRSRAASVAVIACLFVIADVIAIVGWLAWSEISRLALDSTSPFATAVLFVSTLPKWLGGLLYPAWIGWLTVAVCQVFLAQQTRRRVAIGRAGGLILSVLAVVYALPNWPAFTDNNFQRASVNIWEFASAYRASAAEPDPDRSETEDRWAAVELAQPLLIERALTKLAPRDPAVPNVFVVGVAGWSSQDVFLKEIGASLDVLGERFATGSRSVRLVNHIDTVWDTPLASASNLAAALRGVAERMDRETDVLMLVITSHGGKSGIGLEAGPLVRRTLSPANLKRVLDEVGVKNRILVVSACYSGVFVPALADENTTIVTAASAESTSFGCSNERDWTYFGDAFFNHGLREERSLPAAFAKARELIASWEARDGLQPSNPQIHVGASIAAHLPGLLGDAPLRTTAAESSIVK